MGTGRTSPEAARAKVLKDCDVPLAKRILQFARRHYGQTWLTGVLDEVGILDEEGQIPDEEIQLVIPWLLYCHRDANGMTVAEVWRRHERRLTPDEVLLLDAYADAWLSIWEIAEVQRGTGSRVVDALTKEERFVHDVSSSESLERHHAVLGMVVTCDGISFFGGVHGRPLTPRFADKVIHTARRLCRVRTRPVPVERLRQEDIQLELMTIWTVANTEMLHRPPPVMQNTDGDPFVLTTDDFALLAPPDVIATRLATFDGAHEDTEESEEPDTRVFVVTKQGNAKQQSWNNTVVGRIVVGARQLRVETNSTRRADALRTALEQHLRGQVHFRLRSESNTAQLMAEARARPTDSSPQETQPPEILAALREFRMQHMRGWLDKSVPALGGLTPRKASRTERGRRELAVLLKEFEQSEARLPEEQRLDLSWLREELGHL
jgi:hypothetical protein